MTQSKTYRSFTEWDSYPFLILGSAEVILGALQLTGICKSSHPDYPLTGSFYNPGPFACYLAVLLPIAVFAFRNTDHKLTSRMVRWLAMGMALACVILIPASLSRTAMIAAAVGVAIAYWDEVKAFIARHRAIYIVGILLAVSVIAGGLYAVKKNSADGRLMMWTVAMYAAIDAPLTGVGWDNVSGAYGEAQERYFKSGRGSDAEKMVADAPEYVFNEYMQVAIAFGPFALLCMVLAMAVAFVSAFRSGNYRTAGSVVATAVVMTASYPLQFPLFTVTIALILISGLLTSRIIAVRIFGAVLTASGCTLFLTNKDETDVRTVFACGHSQHRSRDYRKSNSILIPLLQKSSDPMILNIIGKNYQALAMPDSAEHYYRKSVFRCPNRMYPHYLLMKLYTDSMSFDKAKCRDEANTILTMPVKIPSPAVDEMQRDARHMINNLSK